MYTKPRPSALNAPALSMPKLVHDQNWVPGLRKAVRSSTAKGWAIREHRGKVRLQVLTEGEPMQSVGLDFLWHEQSLGDIIRRVTNIYIHTKNGYTLKEAANIAKGKAPKLTNKRDWQGAYERFKVQKISFGNGIDPQTTWRKEFIPVLTYAINLLNKNDCPNNPKDLLDQCVVDWEIGSRSREIRIRRLANFLNYCVDREDFPPAWRPPSDLKPYYGRKPKGNKSEKMSSISDQEIINLINSMTETPAAKRWTDCLKLMAVYGLRAVELNHLEVRLHDLTKKPYLYCTYEKRSGSGVTKKRTLEPLPLKNDEGETEEWNLLSRLQAKDILFPKLSSVNGPAEAMRKYMNANQKGWQSLKALMESRGENLGTYSFRHSYSVRGHFLGIDGGSMALAMGHSVKMHEQAYDWSNDEVRSRAFDRARAAS